MSTSSFILESPNNEKPLRSSRAGTIRATDLQAVNKLVSPTSLSESSSSITRNLSSSTPLQSSSSFSSDDAHDTKSNAPFTSPVSADTTPSPSRSAKLMRRNNTSNEKMKDNNNNMNNYDYNYYATDSSSASSYLPQQQQRSTTPKYDDHSYQQQPPHNNKTNYTVYPSNPIPSSAISESKHHSPSLSSASSASSMSLTLDSLDKYHARVKELEHKLKKVQDEDGQKLASLTLALQQALAQNRQENNEENDQNETIAQLRHEIQSLQDDMQQLLEEINNLRDEKFVNEETIEQVTKERDNALDQLTRLEQSIQSSMENVQNVASTVASGQQKLQQAEERIKNLQQTIQETEQRAENAENSLREARAQADQVEANLFNTQAERDQLREKREQLESEHIPNLLASSQENIEKLKEYYENEIQNLRNSFHQQLERTHAEHKDMLLMTELNMQAKVDRTLTESEAAAARVSVEAAEKIATLQLQLEQQKYDYEEEVQALRQNHSNELELERDRHSLMLQKEREQHLQSTLEFDKRMTETSSDFVRQLNDTRAALEKDMASIRSTALAEKEVFQAQMQLQLDAKNKELQDLQELIQDPEKSPVYKFLRQKIHSASVYLDSLRADLKALKRELVLQVRDLHLYSGNIVNDCMRVTVQAIDQVYDLNDTAFGWAEESARLQHDLAIEQENNVSLRTLLSSERLESVHTTSRIVGYATHLRKEMEELRSDLRTLRESATDSIRQTQIEIYNGLADAVQLMVISAAKSGTSSIIDSRKLTESKFGLANPIGTPLSTIPVSSSSSSSSTSTMGSTSNFTSPEAIQIHLKAAEAAVADAKADAERAYQRAKLNLTASDAYVATLQTERESLAKEVILLRSELEKVGANSNLRKKKSSQSSKYFARGSTIDSSNYGNRPTVHLLSDEQSEDDDNDAEEDEDQKDTGRNVQRNLPSTRDYRKDTSNSIEAKNVFAAFQEVLQNNTSMIASNLPSNTAKPNRSTTETNKNSNALSSSTMLHSTSPAYFREAMNIAEEETDNANNNMTDGSKIRIKKRK